MNYAHLKEWVFHEPIFTFSTKEAVYHGKSVPLMQKGIYILPLHSPLIEQSLELGCSDGIKQSEETIFLFLHTICVSSVMTFIPYLKKGGFF